MPKLILATASQFRIEAFKFLGVEFTAEASRLDEYSNHKSEDPKELVIHLAKMKAESVAVGKTDEIILGFDSVGYFDGKVMEKPRTKEEDYERLKSLSGKKHDIYTGIYMINLESKKELSKVTNTKIYMRKFSEEEIKKYLDKDEKYNTRALGYDPHEHYSTTFVRKINGSYNEFIRGIPLEIVVEMLPKIGYKL